MDIPQDIQILFPESIEVSHPWALAYIPWRDHYLNHVPEKYRDFFQIILPYLNVRTTDIHTALCMAYLPSAMQWSVKNKIEVREHIVAISLILHDCGWSLLSDEEIALSLDVTGLQLSATARNPKVRHALEGAQLARKLLQKHQVTLHIQDSEIDDICQAVLFHDRPEVLQQDTYLSFEVKLLADLDHLWSVIREGFWLDTIRKQIDPKVYLENLINDAPRYYITEFGHQTVAVLLKSLRSEVNGRDE